MSKVVTTRVTWRCDVQRCRSSHDGDRDMLPPGWTILTASYRGDNGSWGTEIHATAMPCVGQISKAVCPKHIELAEAVFGARWRK